MSRERKHLIWTLVLAMACGTVSACAPRPEAGHSEAEHPESAHDEHAVARGPHGGRLFVNDALQLELLIEETGIPPEFRAYLYDSHGRPIEPVAGTLTVSLERLGERSDVLAFEAEGDRFRSVRSVEEPHSFRARVSLVREGRTHEWNYEQVEGRVELSAEAVAGANIVVGPSGPRRIEERVETPGEVRLNADHVVQIRPRFPGVIRRMDKALGDHVREGDVLAIVHSNESLSDYEIRASKSGTVVARELAPGAAADHESVLYTIADLSTVWVDFPLYPQAAGRVRRGQPVVVRTDATGGLAAQGTVSYVGPLLEQDTRISYGRVVLPNPGGRWQPGLFVTAAVTVGSVQASVAVPEEAIVRTSRGPAVFRVVGNVFELQPVEPGRSDGTWTEIRSGLEPGARVVTTRAYLLKAELGKSEATHDH